MLALGPVEEVGLGEVPAQGGVIGVEPVQDRGDLGLGIDHPRLERLGNVVQHDQPLRQLGRDGAQAPADIEEGAQHDVLVLQRVGEGRAVHPPTVDPECRALTTVPRSRPGAREGLQ